MVAGGGGGTTGRVYFSLDEGGTTSLSSCIQLLLPLQTCKLSCQLTSHCTHDNHLYGHLPYSRSFSFILTPALLSAPSLPLAVSSSFPPSGPPHHAGCSLRRRDDGEDAAGQRGGRQRAGQLAEHGAALRVLRWPQVRSGRCKQQ